MITFKIKSVEHLTEKALLNIISRFNSEEKVRAKKLKQYYMADNDINKRVKGKYKPNNKVPYQKARQTVDAEVSFFIGNPVTYESENKDLMLELQDMFDANSQITVDMELAEMGSITGVGYELLYINEENNYVESVVLDSEDTFIITDTTFKGKIIAGGYLEHYENLETSDIETRFYLYTEDTITEYLYSREELQFVSEMPHYFNEVPLIPFYNNKFSLGTFETSIPTIDAMDTVLANMLNDSETFAEAILVTPVPKDTMEIVENVVATNLEDFHTTSDGEVSNGLEDFDINVGDTLNVQDSTEVQELKDTVQALKGLVDNVRDSRQMLVAEGNNPFYLNKGGTENAKILEILEDKYRMETSTVDLTKDFSGQDSGIAVQAKMAAMKLVVEKKEGQFRKGLDKRLKLIVDFINWRDNTNHDYKEIVYSFKRKMPINDGELINYVNSLLNSGLISKETALAKSGVVEDPAYELEKVKAEQGNNI